MNDGIRTCKHCGHEGHMLGLTVQVPAYPGGGTGARGKPVKAEDINASFVHPGFHQTLRLCVACERINIIAPKP